jgi:hypothetical protein
VSLHDWDDSGIGGLGCIKQRDLSEASRVAPGVTVKLERSSVAPEKSDYRYVPQLEGSGQASQRQV